MQRQGDLLDEPALFRDGAGWANISEQGKLAFGDRLPAAARSAHQARQFVEVDRAALGFRTRRRFLLSVRG